MERLVGLHRTDRIDYDSAAEWVAREAFADAIRRFHIVNGVTVPVYCLLRSALFA